MTGVQTCALPIFFFIVLQYLQYVTGRSALGAAVAMLPLPLVLMPTARNAPYLAKWLGFARVAPVGLLSMAVGFFLLGQLRADTPYWFFLVGLAFYGLGMGLAGTPSTTAITSSLPPEKQGVASAVNDVSRELGSAFGIAILGAVLNQSYQDALAPSLTGLPPAMAERALSSIAFTSSPAIAQAGPAAAVIVEKARDAFVAGVGDALQIASVVLVTAAVAVFLLARGAKAADEA